MIEFGLLGFIPPWVGAVGIAGGLPWLLLTLKALTRFGLGHGGGPLSVQLDLPGAKMIAGVLVLFTWPLAGLIPLLIYAVSAHAVAAAFVGPRGLIALSPIVLVVIGAAGVGYLAVVGILFAARTPKTAHKKDAIPDFDPERLLRLTLPIGCAVIGLSLGQLGGSLERLSLPSNSLVVPLYLPFRYLIERVGGLSWLSVSASMCAVAGAVLLPLLVP